MAPLVQKRRLTVKGQDFTRTTGGPKAPLKPTRSRLNSKKRVSGAVFSRQLWRSVKMWPLKFLSSSAGEGQAKVDETLTFVENMLYKIGSKLVPGIGKIAWVEAPSLPV